LNCLVDLKQLQLQSIDVHSQAAKQDNLQIKEIVLVYLQH